MRWATSLPAGLAALACSVTASAAGDGPRPAEDPTLGRIDGDLTLSAGLGVALAPRAPRPALDLRLRYLSTVGVFLTYEDGATFDLDSVPSRVVAGGLELRPLFFGRWLRGMEVGASRSPLGARADLALDSLGLELGTFVAQRSAGGLRPHPGLHVGVGLEAPILARASGPWIGAHVAGRFSETAIADGHVASAHDRQLVLLLTVAWHQVFGAHLVDAGDRAPR